MANYYMALDEVNEILDHMDNKFISKIPNDLLEIIKNYKLGNSNFKYDLTKSLSEQNIHKETLEILSYLNYNFWLNEDEKQEYRKIYYDNFLKIENEKSLKYNPNDIFKNRLKNHSKPVKNEIMPIKKVENNFFIKLINKIKAIIKGKNV